MRRSLSGTLPRHRGGPWWRWWTTPDANQNLDALDPGVFLAWNGRKTWRSWRSSCSRRPQNLGTDPKLTLQRLRSDVLVSNDVGDQTTLDYSTNRRGEDGRRLEPPPPPRWRTLCSEMTSFTTAGTVWSRNLRRCGEFVMSRTCSRTAGAPFCTRCKQHSAFSPLSLLQDRGIPKTKR